jgi:hypothetical protein
MRKEPFFGSVFWGPTWIESCVMDAGSARVTGGTLMKITNAIDAHRIIAGKQPRWCATSRNRVRCRGSC